MKAQEVPASRHSVVVATLLLGLFALAPLLYCEYRWRTARPHAMAGQDSTSMAQADFAKLVERMDRQKDQRSEWAYAALVAIVAISVVKKAFNIPWVRPAYAFLGTAGVFMFESIRAGDAYEQSVTLLFLLPNVPEANFNHVVDLLLLQLRWLNIAAAMLMMFVGAFLMAVLSGKVRLETEVKS